MGRRIYVASSWRNTYQPSVVNYLRLKGHQVYNPNSLSHGFHWSEIDPNWQEWDNLTYLNILLTHPLVEQGFESDRFAMQWADTCVLALPSGQSSHLEAGQFINRRNKRLYVLFPSEKIAPDLMYRMATGLYIDLTELEAALWK